MKFQHEIEVGQTVTLRVGTTNRLRQLIRDHGITWMTTDTSRTMQCFGGDAGVAIISLDGRHERNVRLTDLVDFFKEAGR